MTKYEIASYLSDLISIMESKEDAGRPKGQTLGWEYERAYGEMTDIIRKEKEDEARKSERERTGGSEDRTGVKGSEPSRSGSAREYGWPGSGRGADVPGQGVQSSHVRGTDSSMRKPGEA